MWSTGEGNGKPLQYSCLENPMNSMKRQKGRTLKEELPRSVGTQYATGDQWRNNSRKNEGMEPKQKQYPAVDVTGDRSKVRCCKEQYWIGTWNIRTTSNLPWFMDLTFQFLCNIALYSIGPCFYHQSHPQLGVVFALAPRLHSFWSYFSTDLQ